MTSEVHHLNLRSWFEAATTTYTSANTVIVQCLRADADLSGEHQLNGIVENQQQQINNVDVWKG